MKKLVALTFSAAFSMSAAAQSVVTVSPHDMKGWAFFDDSSGGPCLSTSTCRFATGPEGVESAQLALTTSSDRPTLGARIDAIAGVRLVDLGPLSYRHLVTQNFNVQAVALQFAVDRDVTDTNYDFQGRVVFEPYWSPDQGPVVLNQWKTWDAAAGRWWLSRAGNAAQFAENVCSQSSPCTLQQLAGHYPNIGVRDVPTEPNTFLKAGSGWTAFNGYVDWLRIGSVTYDFNVGPTSKEGCYNNGWVGYFKNQGQCVSKFVSANPN